MCHLHGNLEAPLRHYQQDVAHLQPTFLKCVVVLHELCVCFLQVMLPSLLHDCLRGVRVTTHNLQHGLVQQPLLTGFS